MTEEVSDESKRAVLESLPRHVVMIEGGRSVYMGDDDEDAVEAFVDATVAEVRKREMPVAMDDEREVRVVLVRGVYPDGVTFLAAKLEGTLLAVARGMTIEMFIEHGPEQGELDTSLVH